ncbi:hypothetical protein PAXRUDRAFT_831407 [Paxillus rubicundulus Ve08.2h10]|uniref:Uncharacterized protein n=1 Tax=Paxillus rubicundulus Ve08.2h10 TaxID=930991 RepID=A0A0D0DS22_9AGAM|nr:hypothetical protein PAXRUDRAFT_831407 [Paxillus rubicundulus Ve08.2h10]
MEHWDLRILDGDGQKIRKSFDHLIVASGHNHYPHIPTFDGLEEWLGNGSIDDHPREILHFIQYREPDCRDNRCSDECARCCATGDLGSRL